MLPPFRPPCAEGLVVRRSHKSNLIHPALVSGTEQHELVGADGSAELAAEAVEVHLRAGDALLFVDCAPPQPHSSFPSPCCCCCWGCCWCCGGLLPLLQPLLYCCCFSSGPLVSAATV